MGRSRARWGTGLLLSAFCFCRLNCCRVGIVFFPGIEANRFKRRQLRLHRSVRHRCAIGCVILSERRQGGDEYERHDNQRFYNIQFLAP